MGFPSVVLKRFSVVVALILATKAIGFARELIVAHIAGIGPIYDAFLVAYAPTWVAILLLSEPLRLSVLVALRGVGDAGRAEMKSRLLFSAIKWSLALWAAVVVAGLGWAELVARSKSGTSLESLPTLVMAVSPIVSLSLVATVAGAILLYENRVVWVSSIELLQSALILALSAGTLGPWGAVGLSSSYSIGFLCGAILLAVPAMARGRFLPDNSILRLALSKGFRDVLCANGLFWIGTFSERWVGVSLGEGNVSALGYAFRVAFFPIGVVAGAVSLAGVPEIVRSGESREGGRLAGNVLLTCLLALGAVSAFLFMNATAISNVLAAWGAGRLQPASESALSRSLVGYALGVLTYGAALVASRLLQGLGHTRPCVVAGVLGLGTVMALNAILPKFCGPLGVSLSFSCASGLMALWLVGALLIRIPTARASCGSVVSMFVCWGIPVALHIALPRLMGPSRIILLVECVVVAGLCCAAAVRLKVSDPRPVEMSVG